MKRKVLSIFVALVLALSLCLVTAVPVVGQESSIYSDCSFATGGDGTAEWSTDTTMGAYSVKLGVTEFIEGIMPDFGWVKLDTPPIPLSDLTINPTFYARGVIPVGETSGPGGTAENHGPFLNIMLDTDDDFTTVEAFFEGAIANVVSEEEYDSASFVEVESYYYKVAGGDYLFPYQSLAEAKATLAEDHPETTFTVVGVQIMHGDTWFVDPNQVVYIDDVQVNDITYDLEQPPAVWVDDTGDNTNPGTETEPFLTIQHAIDILADGTVNVAAGTYSEGQIVVDSDVSVVGDAVEKPVIRPTTSLIGNDDDYAWFLVNPEVTFALSNVVLDGSEFYIWQAIRNHGHTTIDNVDFRIIKSASSSYMGVAVLSLGGTVPGGGGSESHSGGLPASHLVVTGSTFEEIGRVGVVVKGSESTADILNCTYTGKGDGDWIDYAFEAGAGGDITVEDGCTVTNCKGFVSVDAISAAIYVTTYYGDGTRATITANTLTGNIRGIAVGYDGEDTSTVVAQFNNISGNAEYGVESTGPDVDATNNYWGHSSGPSGVGDGFGDAVSMAVDFEPWLLEEQETATTFEKTLALREGWTLFSVDKTVEDLVWAGTIELAYKHTPTGGFVSATSEDLYPLTAIFIKSDGGAGVGFNYPEGTPAIGSKNLEAGWNLIGSPSGIEEETLLAQLRYVTVGTEQIIGLTSLVSPGEYNLSGTYFDVSTLFEGDWSDIPNLDPFDGFWANMEADEVFEVPN